MIMVHAFGGENVLLGGGLVVDAVEGKGEFIGFILGAGDLDEGQGHALGDPVGAYNDIFVVFFLEQRADTSDDANRHCAWKCGNQMVKETGRR